MTDMGTWRVTGRRAYRGHDPGETFDARLPGGAARRAIERGDIEFLGPAFPCVQPGSFTLPPGWTEDPPPGGRQAGHIEGTQAGALLIEGSK